MVNKPRSRSSGGSPGQGSAIGGWAVAAGLVFVVGLLSVEQLHSDRLPLPVWLPSLTVLVTGAAAGLGISGRVVKLVALGLAGFVWLLIAASGVNVDAVLSVVVVVPILGIGIAIGWLVRRLTPTSAGRVLPIVAAGMFVLACLPYPVAVIEAGRTVRVAHAELGGIDGPAGTFRGVGLGQATAAVTARFGRPPVGEAGTNPDPYGPLAGGSVFDGPGSLDVGSPPVDTFLRYPEVAFQIRRGRVRWVQIIDPAEATSAGVGVGDSMSRVRQAYPAARCGEDSIHEEPDYVAYPYCEVRLSADRWLAFFGTYREPGKPVLGIWLSTYRLESPT